MKRYYTYILASHSNEPALYIGVTSDLELRINQHKQKVHLNSFSDSYNCDKLVYFETTESVETAIGREKQLKRWHREWKLNLIGEQNPDLRDLSLDWSRHNQETLKQVQGDNLRARDGSFTQTETSSA